MDSYISIDDLDAPIISEAGKKVLAQRASVPVEFSLQGLLDYVESLSDVPIYYGDSDFFSSLEKFMEEGNRKGPFSVPGKKFIAATFANFILQRSRLEWLFDSNPEISDVEIEAPLVITGLPRSGTTHLSNILAVDKRLNFLAFWEGYNPFPSMEEISSRPTLGEDRAELWRTGLEDMYKVVPYVRNMMDVPFDGAIEELIFFHIAGMPLGQMNHAYTPEWNSRFWNQMQPDTMYRMLRRSLQAMQWLRGNTNRWVLKSPHHLAYLDTLRQVFPDSHIVITHRDPASSLISNATMISYLFRETHDDPSPGKAFEVASQMGQGMAKGLVRDIDSMDLDRVSHVYFHEYMHDVMGVLESIYRRAGLSFTETIKKQLLDYIDTHPRGRHGGRLMYNPERDFGLTREQIRESFQFYIDRFPVKIESDHA